MPRTVSDPEGQRARIRAMRMALGLTQEQLADAMGVHRVNVVRVESGANQATSHPMRLALARGFGLDLDSLEELLSGKVTVETLLRRRSRRMARAS